MRKGVRQHAQSTLTTEKSSCLTVKGWTGWGWGIVPFGLDVGVRAAVGDHVRLHQDQLGQLLLGGVRPIFPLLHTNKRQPGSGANKEVQSAI